jgi:5-formyltetrahydrofolate cyclo-ligase
MNTAASAVVLKRELRARMRSSALAASPTLVASESDSLRASLLSHPAYISATRVALYAPMPTETDVSPLLHLALTAGKRVFLPRVAGLRELHMLEVRSAEEEALWPANSWGIREPPVDEGRAEAGDADVGLDLVVVPGMAFDLCGNRCGYGKGYYDTFFARYHASHGGVMPKLIALALSHQIVDQVPMTGLDWRVDEVILPALNKEV